MNETIASSPLSILDQRSFALKNQQGPTDKPAEPKKVADDEVRTISTSEYKGAAQALAEAFWEDEVARYFIDTPDRVHWSEQDKWDLHVSILECMTYAHSLNGIVTTAGLDYGCVALW